MYVGWTREHEEQEGRRVRGRENQGRRRDEVNDVVIGDKKGESEGEKRRKVKIIMSRGK